MISLFEKSVKSDFNKHNNLAILHNKIIMQKCKNRKKHQS